MRVVTLFVFCGAVSLTAAGCSKGASPPASIVSPSSTAAAGTEVPRFGDRTPGVVFVTSQQLYYDTFVVKDPLPKEGRFQLLTNGRTEFGPGQPGYLGGRWWEDLNGDGVQDAGDHYFLCPHLPPGRPTP
jgi:hypothetical protein